MRCKMNRAARGCGRPDVVTVPNRCFWPAMNETGFQGRQLSWSPTLSPERRRKDGARSFCSCQARLTQNSARTEICPVRAPPKSEPMVLLTIPKVDWSRLV